MKIVIVGNGKTGYVLAESLSAENHDVTLIDSDEDTLNNAAERLDIMYMKGSGTSLSTLKQADAARAGVVIAVTSSDEINMLCCTTSKKLGAKRTIARIRAPEYVKDAETLGRQLEIDIVINPERSAAHEILRLIRFPAAVEIDEFYRGRVEIIGFRVRPEDGLTGIPLIELRKKSKSPVLFCVVERGGEVMIPRGDFALEAGDLAYIAGKYSDIAKFFRIIGRSTGKAGNVMIIGGGRTGHYVAQVGAAIGLKPVIIERDEKRCAWLAEDVPQATVICADGTDQELLESENIREMDFFAALTDRDESNMIISLLAQQCGVKKVITKVERPHYIPIAGSIGIDTIISPNEITENLILHFVRGLSASRGGAVVSMRRLLDGRLEALEFIVGGDLLYLGEKIKNMKIKHGVLIAVISRGSKSIIPEGEDVLLEGDDVVIVTTYTGFDELNDIFDR